MGFAIFGFAGALALLQIASDGLYGDRAATRSVVAGMPSAFGRRVYLFLDRVAPAPYVEATLARDALRNGDGDGASRYAVRLPASPVRDDLLARVALAQHRPQLAFEYFLAAPDVAAVQAIVDRRAQYDPLSAYLLEALLQRRVERLRAHPDALAEISWRLGLLANQTAWREVPGSALQSRWLKIGLRHFMQAADIAPLSERYAIAAANQADLCGDELSAGALFHRASSLDPSSADAIAGLGVVAFRRGDRGAAATYLQRADALDPNAAMVRALKRDLR
ncbi:MAG: hypothetical protein JO030_07385 [Candidatus Eremiobacteraeota bacterium]|nr:hypothetical protein [Candidatus Eremiobacteraeota bacterium]